MKTKQEEKPYHIYHEFFGVSIKRQILKLFKKNIRDEYWVKDIVQIPNTDRWIVKLEKDFVKTLKK